MAKKTKQLLALESITEKQAQVKALIDEMIRAADEAGVEFYFNPTDHYGTGVTYVPATNGRIATARAAWEKLTAEQREALGLSDDFDGYMTDIVGESTKTGWVSSSDQC